MSMHHRRGQAVFGVVAADHLISLGCVTGDHGGVLQCAGAGGAPPTTLAKFTLNSPVDFYDGYNMPVSIFPTGGSGECKVVTCVSDLNWNCLKDLQVLRNGCVAACNSACMAFNKPEYCCTGAYSTPVTCKPTDHSKVLKEVQNINLDL
ncbi:pathogenesis-related thaumatin-like protein 3.5 [Vitis riparia]|uniref:pathogenesis-related thaumatin-like protein 3.5 n=1 Tax=Vitis riparia TaxID=96939 RepID=UPI00155B0242|nr:pathogenesis-related thaumatin-like protein 3.5 [Vitis riparia]